MRALFQDLRYGARLFIRQPGFTGVVLTTLALAIGANTIIFSIASFLLLRPLPFEDRDTLVAVSSVDPQRGDDRARVSHADFAEWRDEARSFEALGAFTSDTLTLTGHGDATRLEAQRVTANLFDLWGVGVTSGRGFDPGDDQPGAQPVVILSDGFWRRQFAADPEVIGQTLRLDGVPCTVVGVLTPEMEIGTLSLIDVWAPLVIDRQAPRETRRLAVYGRLKAGVSVEQASAEVAAIARRQAQDHPTTSTGWGARAIPLMEAMTGRNSWLVLAMLGVVVSLVLVIACANIANLMLARAVTRRKEFAMRAAIGAGRLRIVRQLIVESLLIGVAGGAAGLAIAVGGLRVIKAVTYEPFFKQIEVDYRVLAFVAVLSLVTPLVFSLLPALSSARMNLSEAMSEGAGRTSGGRRGRRSRNLLVVAQLSLATALLVLSTLVIRTAVAASQVRFGFDPERVLTLQIELDGPRYADDESVRQFSEAALARLGGLPGVTSAAATSALPVFGRATQASFSIAGRPEAKPSDQPWALETIVSPGYFKTFDIPLTRGRGFTDADRPGAPPVALVSAETARRYWPADDAIGQRIQLSGTTEWIEIVGVVSDVFNREEFTETFDPAFYLPAAQHPRRALAFALRTTVDPSTLAAAVRSEIRAEDPDQAVFDVQPMTQLFREALASDRLLYGMFASFALLALALAGGGLYGLMSYSVAQRTQEFGVRLALGARTRDVVRQVVRQALTLAGVGIALGLLTGLALAYAVASLLFGVGPTDPATYATVAATLALVALAAGYFPARRALADDPIRALRQ